MARADRRSAQRASRAAAGSRGIRASGQARAVEQTLFFARLRRNAKWVFLGLAFIFALSFVVFGVGAGGTGIGDILRGGSSASGPDIEGLQADVDAHPRDPGALRKLAEGLIDDNQIVRAIPILERYSQVRPKDVDTLNELAGLYETRAARLRGQAQLAQLRVSAATPEQDVLPASTTPLGKAIGTLPISSAVAQAAQSEFNAKYGEMQSAYRQAQTVYERIVVLQPDNAAAQRGLGDAALYANDTTTSIAAYKRFLELAPDDPEAPTIKQQLKQLEAQSQAPVSPSG
jgi:tetratricopeptide (TPR) repeat protein